MFNGGWGSPSFSADYLKKQLVEEENKEDEHDKDIQYAVPI